MLDEAPTQSLAAQIGVDSQVVNPANPRFRVEGHCHITHRCPVLRILGNRQLSSWRIDVPFDVSPFPPLPVPPGDRAEPLVDVVVDRDSRKRRDGERDHGRSVGLAKRSNDEAHLHLPPGFEDPSWPVKSASTPWYVVMGSAV